MTSPSDAVSSLEHLYPSIEARVRQILAQRAYVGRVIEDGPDPEASGALYRAAFDGVTSPDEVRALVEAHHAQGRIGLLARLEWLTLLASRPDVQDWPGAMRLLGEMERLTWTMDDERRNQNLASIARHRGVVAYLEGHYSVALEYFLDAVNRVLTLPNIHNLLCVTLRLSGRDAAQGLYAYIQSLIPEDAARDLAERIHQDPDLILLSRSGGSHEQR